MAVSRGIVLIMCGGLWFATLAQSSANPAPHKPTQAKPTQTKASQKPRNKPKKRPVLPAQSILDSMAKKGELIDFGEAHFSQFASRLLQPTHDQGLRIAIFGDSHIAGDVIPEVLRTRLVQVDSIGFAYPIFPAFHQNLLVRYEHKGFEIINSRKDGANSYPLGGLIARAKSEKAFVHFALNLPKDHQDFSVRVVFRAPSDLGAFVVRDSSGKSKRLGAKKAHVWEISAPMSLRFPIHIESLLPNAMLGGYIIKQKNDSYVVNLGINGARSDIYTKWEQKLWQEELGLLDLDFIVLSYGSNDAIFTTINTKLYKENFAKFIRTLRKIQPRVSILLLGAPEVRLRQKNGTYTISKSYEAMRKATKELAQEEHTLYFDMERFITENGGKQKWIDQALSKPDVHLTPYGYKLVAESLTIHLKNLAQSSIKTSNKPKAIIEESNPTSSQSHQAQPSTDTASDTAQEAANPTNPKDTAESSLMGAVDSSAQESTNTSNTTQDSTQQAIVPSIESLPLPAESTAPEEIWQDLELKDFSMPQKHAN